HLDCLVAWEESDGAFACPCHGSRFARDGSPLSGPASRALDRFPVLITDSAGTVVAETDVSTGAPLALPQSQPPAAMDEAAPADDPDDPEDSEEAIPDDLLVLVDTGRKIIGTPFAPA
ncbi:MAG: ubiquinol-cytochrome c reductase iron-sulfur subunit, partial [Anaerolineae bacterium]